MSRSDHTNAAASGLQRVVGVPGAILMGLGSILGTGIFVNVGIAADVTGASVTLAVPLAALVATFNGLSSAQLAASHPVSGGTYEYGYRYLSPPLGFTAGWMFLCAKSASAATAALGLAGYVLVAFSAFTVLVYYALTNLAALRLPAASRLYPRWVSVAGLVCCLGLAFWVEARIWASGLALIGVGLLWHRLGGAR